MLYQNRKAEKKFISVFAFLKIEKKAGYATGGVNFTTLFEKEFSQILKKRTLLEVIFDENSVALIPEA